MTETISIDQQIEALSWLIDREDKPRLKELLTNPEQIPASIIDHLHQLNVLNPHGYGRETQITNPIINEKWSILREALNELKPDLNKAKMFVYLGGSLLYGDPSNDPDYDVVTFSFEDNQDNVDIARNLEYEIYKLDGNVRIVDVVHVNLESIQILASQLSKNQFNKLDKMTRMQVHYFGHLANCKAMFVPDSFSQSTPENIRQLILTEIFFKVPFLGALLLIDLEKVVKHRNNRRLGLS